MFTCAFCGADRYGESWGPVDYYQASTDKCFMICTDCVANQVGPTTPVSSTSILDRVLYAIFHELWPCHNFEDWVKATGGMEMAIDIMRRSYPVRWGNRLNELRNAAGVR